MHNQIVILIFDTQLSGEDLRMTPVPTMIGSDSDCVLSMNAILQMIPYQFIL